MITSQGSVGGVYVWKIQMPLLVTHESGSETRSDSNIVTMLVMRVPTSLKPGGIAIDRISFGTGGA